MCYSCMAQSYFASLRIWVNPVMVYPGAKNGFTGQHDGRHAYAAIKRLSDYIPRP
jgi:hypothetical protein